jgi:antitoxin VapB
VLSPVENTWDSFFLSDDGVSDDFITERASQEQSERESF